MSPTCGRTAPGLAGMKDGSNAAARASDGRRARKARSPAWMRDRDRASTFMTRFVDHYLAALLAQASHLISSEFHAVVRAHGLSVSEWRVLASLAGGEPIPIGQLA